MAQFDGAIPRRPSREDSGDRVARPPIVGLRLLGNAFHGIGIPDCIREAKRCAETLY